MYLSTRVINIDDQSRVGEARRTAVAMAEAGGIDEIGRTNVAIIATELSNNLLRYSHDGKMLLQWHATLGGGSLDLIALDKGPGIADLDTSMRDGHSTGGTPGTGLGAVRRLSTEFDIVSQVSVGTIVFSRVATDPKALETLPLRLGAISIAAPHEEECGDMFRIFCSERRCDLLVADGLGHGPGAAQAAQAVADVFVAKHGERPEQVIELAHRAASGTRGAAVAIASLDVAQQQLQYCGVGNIAGRLLGGDSSVGMVSHNGIVGAQMRKAQPFSYSWQGKRLLVMHSDGIQSRWNLDAFSHLATRHPAIIAAALSRDFVRGRDDLTVLVAARKG